MIQSKGRSIYFGGDAGYSSHFTQTRLNVCSPDVALLGMGAYEPQWFMKPMHMNPAEAVQAHQDLQAHYSIGMHFGTFPLAKDGFDQPLKDLYKVLETQGSGENPFLILQEGETRLFKGSSR